MGYGFVKLCLLSAVAALWYACSEDSSSAVEYDYDVVGESSSSVEPMGSLVCGNVLVDIPVYDVPPEVVFSQPFDSVPPISFAGFQPLSSGAEVSEAFPPQSSAFIPPHSSVTHYSSELQPTWSSFASMSSAPASSASEPLPDFSFYRGADISTVQEYERWGAKFYDTDGSEKDIFTLLKNHGFNAIRLKTFVTPQADYGYAAPGCDHDAEAYADKAHVIDYAKKVKAAGMAFLLDIHYSDNWADPGHQVVPSRWRSVQSSDAMADSVYSYTYDLVFSLKAAGAVPDMVQIGNETTPGILMHVPNENTNCWGEPVNLAPASVNGDMSTSSGKANAGKYFKAGIRAVKAVSPSTKTVLHIESIRKPNIVNWWMTEIFKNQDVPADVMGFSAYTAYGDGAPDSWNALFSNLVSAYPDLEFIVAEYNGGDAENHYMFDGSRGRTDEMVRNLDRWIGAFFWEPTLNGAWGSPLFDWDGPNLRANKDAFDEYRK